MQVTHQRRLVVAALALVLALALVATGCSRLQSIDDEATMTQEDLAQRVTLLEQEVADLQVTVSELQTAQADARQPAEPTVGDAGIAQPVIAVVTGTPGYLNVRRSADINSEKVGVLTEGAQVEVLEVNGDWSKINFADRLQGWVSNKYIENRQ